METEVVLEEVVRTCPESKHVHVTNHVLPSPSNHVRNHFHLKSTMK